jgi:DNA-binding Xre family transcriptional regulator
MLSQYERMLENYRDWYPDLYLQTNDYRPSGRYRILLRLDDGSRLEYNDLDNTIRDVTKYYDRETCDELDEETWRKEFGRNLRRIIAEKSITQEVLADQAGISRQMLSRYVRGTSTPSGYILNRLSRILDCDVRDLTRFGYIDEE